MDKSVDARQRIVIYRLGSLGDTVVALPCFHLIERTWPNAERIVLTNFPVSSKAAPLEVILRESGLIHSAIAYPVGTRSLGELWHLGRQLRALKADVLVYLTPARGLPSTFRDWLFFKLCGFKSIVGAPLTADLQRCRSLGTTSSTGEKEIEGECERLARCMAPLGKINLDEPALWDLRLTPRELLAGAAMVAPLLATPFIAINMGGKSRANDWGLPNWTTLIKELSGDFPSMGLLVVGAAEDSERATLVASHWSGPVVDACGKLSPRESAAAMRGALAFVGHDSGPMHLAAAVRVRCVALFGGINQPKRWHPRGEQHRIIHKMTGMNSISVAEVHGAVRDVTNFPQALA